MMMQCLIRSSLVLVSAMTIEAEERPQDGPLVLISSFTRGEDGAITAFRLNSKTGELKRVQRNTDVEHPFFLAVSPDQKHVYSIHTPAFGGKEHEEIVAFDLDAETGKLTTLNRQSARGSASCYLAVDATGKTVLVANYSTGSVAALPVNSDGSLKPATAFVQHAGSSVNPARQKGPFAHSIIVSPDNRFAFAADLGLDQILCYRLDAATGTLIPNTQSFVRTPPGAGPRHLTFHPNGKHLYAINELKNSVTAFDYQMQSGLLIERQTISTLPADYQETTHCADLKVTPDGRYLYGTNRGHDSIACYKIATDGTLKLIEIVSSRGQGPQNLAITDDGRWLLCANMPAGNVSVFQIDSASGKLKPTGEPAKLPMPSCIMLLSK